MSTRAQLLAAVQTDFPTNNAREITAEVLRDFLDDYIDSVWIPETDGTPPTYSGTTLTFGTVQLVGTASRVYTLPSTSATIARTDAAQTFTGTQTFGAILASSVAGLSSGASLSLSVSGTAGIGLNTTTPNSQGTSFPVTTIGAIASRGSGTYDSYSILELAAAADGTDSSGIQSNEVDWVWPGYSISATKKKLAAIEVFLSGPTAGDRGGEWRLDTKADGGALTSAIIVDRFQETQFRAIYAEGINAANGGAKLTQNGLTFAIDGPTANAGSFVKFQNSNTAINWQIIQNQNNAGALEVMPSTAAGGTTFTTTAWYWDSSGNFKDAGAHTLTVNGAVLSVTASVLNISTSASVGTAGSNTTLTIGGATPSGNNTSRLRFSNTNSTTNWQIGSNDNAAGTLEFTPSTASGGSTFTTPRFSLTTTTAAFSSGVTVAANNTTEATTGGAGSLSTAGGIYAAKKIITASTLTTLAGVTWDLGAAAVVSPTSPNRTLKVTVGGTDYYIAAKTTND